MLHTPSILAAHLVTACHVRTKTGVWDGNFRDPLCVYDELVHLLGQSWPVGLAHEVVKRGE